MLKVLILDRCPHCEGEAYIFTGEAIDYNGEYYPATPPACFAKAAVCITGGSACASSLIS